MTTNAFILYQFIRNPRKNNSDPIYHGRYTTLKEVHDEIKDTDMQEYVIEETKIIERRVKGITTRG